MMNKRTQFQPPFNLELLSAEDPGEDHTKVTSLHPPLRLPALSPDSDSGKRLISLLPIQQAHTSASVIAPMLIKDRSTLPVWWKQKRFRVLLIVCVVSIVLVASVVLARASTPDVSLYQVGEQDVTQAIGGGGIIYPRQQLNLSYPAAERVVSVYIKAGDVVQPNQPLLKLDPTLLNAQVKQAADDVAAAQSYLNSVSSSGNAVSIAQAQQQYNLAKNKYNALVAQSYYPLVHDGKLVSPMKGVVTAVNINAGEVFNADTTLLTIMDESTVVVRVKVPLANLSQVHLQQKALVTPSALPDFTFTGEVSSIIPQADPQTDTFEVWVSLDNSERRLLPGMSAFVRMQLDKKAMLVPRLAVLDTTQQATVFVERERHVYARHVEVSGRLGNTVLISRGLRVGDRVVMVGLHLLHDGQEVHVRVVQQHAII